MNLLSDSWWLIGLWRAQQMGTGAFRMPKLMDEAKSSYENIPDMDFGCLALFLP